MGEVLEKKFLILKDIESGILSLRQLAGKYNCSLETVLRIKKEGWDYRPHGRKKPEKLRKKIIELYEKGMSIKEIARNLDERVSESSIRKILRKPDRELEIHLCWYAREGKWDLFRKHIGKMYTVEDVSFLASVPDELLPAHLKVSKAFYLYCNTNYGVKEILRDLEDIEEDLNPRMQRTRFRIMGLKIYLIPQLIWDSRETYSRTIKEVAERFQMNRESLKKLSDEYYLLALSTYCLYLLHTGSNSFMKHTGELIKGLGRVKDMCIKNALMTRLRIPGFPQFANKQDPNHVISVLFSGDFESVKELYEKHRDTDIDSVKNRLNYAMFYVNLFAGRLEEARHFLEKMHEQKATPGVSMLALEIAQSNLLMAMGKKQEALKKVETCIDRSGELSILFGKTKKAFTPRHRIARYYEMGKLKESYRLAQKYHLMGLLMIIILTRPKHITRLKSFPELRPLYKLLLEKDIRVRVLLLRKKPRIIYLRESIELKGDQVLFLLKLLDGNRITVPRKKMRRYRKIIKLLENSCTIKSHAEEDTVVLWIKDRNILYDIHEFEQKARQSMKLMESGKSEEARRLKREARKMVQAIPFFQDAYRDLEASYILDRLLNYIKYVNA